MIKLTVVYIKLDIDLIYGLEKNLRIKYIRYILFTNLFTFSAN